MNGWVTVLNVVLVIVIFWVLFRIAQQNVVNVKGQPNNREHFYCPLALERQRAMILRQQQLNRPMFIR